MIYCDKLNFKNFINLDGKKYLLILITIILISCRIISIKFTPDLYVDELFILNHINSILSTGVDCTGYLTLFPIVGAGLSTYVYFYPMLAILSVIGVTPSRARLIQQILTILACFLLAYGVKNWTENKKLFWIFLFL